MRRAGCCMRGILWRISYGDVGLRKEGKGENVRAMDGWAHETRNIYLFSNTFRDSAIPIQDAFTG